MPSTAEAQEITSSLPSCDAEPEIVGVDTDIAHTWTHFQELRQRRELLKKHIDQFEALVSSAR